VAKRAEVHLWLTICESGKAPPSSAQRISWNTVSMSFIPVPPFSGLSDSPDSLARCFELHEICLELSCLLPSRKLSRLTLDIAFILISDLQRPGWERIPTRPTGGGAYCHRPQTAWTTCHPYGAFSTLSSSNPIQSSMHKSAVRIPVQRWLLPAFL